MRTGFYLAFAFAFASCTATAFGQDAKKPYTSDDVVKFMMKQKAKVQGRAVCVESEDDCVKVESFDMVITFDINSANLKPESKENLRKIAEALRTEALQRDSFRIEGFTDARGPDAFNMKLSKDRARAVEQFLAQNSVDTTRMTAVGYGAKSPRDTDPFSPANRRVELKLKSD